MTVTEHIAQHHSNIRRIFVAYIDRMVYETISLLYNTEWTNLSTNYCKTT